MKKVGMILILTLALPASNYGGQSSTEFRGFNTISDLVYDHTNDRIIISGFSSLKSVALLEKNGESYSIFPDEFNFTSYIRFIDYLDGLIFASSNFGIEMRSISNSSFNQFIAYNTTQIQGFTTINGSTFLILGITDLGIISNSEVIEIPIPGMDYDPKVRVRYHPHRNEILVSNSIGDLYFYDIGGNQIDFYQNNILDYTMDPNSAKIATYSNNNLTIIGGPGDNNITIQVTFQEEITEYEYIYRKRATLEYSKSSENIGVSHGQFFQVYNLESKDLIFSWKSNDSITDQVWINDNQVLIGDYDGFVYLLDIANQDISIILERIPAELLNATFGGSTNWEAIFIIITVILFFGTVKPFSRKLFNRS